MSKSTLFAPVALTWKDFLPPADLSDFRIHSREAGTIDVFDASKTRQEFAAECDINVLMERYEKSGVAITHVNQAKPVYMDMTSIPDFRESLDILREATVAFNSLPAKLRFEMDNDPVNFVEWAQNGENLDKLREYGLAPPAKQAPEPVVVKVLAEPPPPEPTPTPKPKA